MPRPSRSSVRVSYPRFDRDQLLALLRQRLPALQARLPLRRVVLIGSWARGRQTAASDIDLLVVYDGPPREDAFATVKRALGISQLEPHVYSAAEARAVRDRLARMAAGGVVVFSDPDRPSVNSP
ncbi:MAG: nucleotidyltransferase domain-containing protein [Armatimonadota bacterium]|nr:nucleotidyltransferase domain-containing protein [Armatimonadota bacterium]MDR7532440.1 nucleotidyltransferase domain-containing protein [Armatimonadota bacterium]MDR7535663.1 nucleotidyltransferase domain-containing protein [Armatimonadota bacterium]